MSTPSETGTSPDAAVALPSTALTPIGADEPEAEFIARRSLELGALFRAQGVNIGAFEAQALIINAFGVLMLAGASQEIVAEYCLRVWSAIRESLDAHEAEKFRAMPAAPGIM